MNQATLLTAIHQLLLAHFNEGELRTLCMGLGVEYEDLAGSGRSDKARELVTYLNRRGRLGELETAVLAARPHAGWPGSPGDSPLPSPLPGTAVREPAASRPQAAGPQGTAGGIHARTIQAENVVQGMQQLGGDMADSTDALALAQALSSGRISADSIAARNVVAGLQYIADPAQATPAQLRQEVATLRRQLAEAVAASGGATNADASTSLSTSIEDAQEALARAETELAQAKPHGGRIVRRLKEAADLLTESARTAESAHTLGQALLKLAPVAAMLYQVAVKLFGG